MPASTFDPEQLRSAMQQWSTGVTIVAAVHEGVRHGMTVNSFTSISLDPAWVTISLQKSARTHELICQAGSFGLTILALDQKELADRFSGRRPDIEDRFADLETVQYLTGAPLLKGGLAHLDCRVLQRIEVGINSLFIAEVLAASSAGSGEPLIYHERQYWRLVDHNSSS